MVMKNVNLFTNFNISFVNHVCKKTVDDVTDVLPQWKNEARKEFSFVTQEENTSNTGTNNKEIYVTGDLRRFPWLTWCRESANAHNLILPRKNAAS